MADRLAVDVGEQRALELEVEPARVLAELTMPHEQTVDAIRKLLEALPSDVAVIEVLREVLVNRCPRCLEHDPNGQLWCCYDSRGD